MKHHFHRGVGQQATDWLEVADGQRIHDGGPRLSTHLDQVNPVHVPVEGRRLGVEGDARLPLQMAGERL